MRLPLKMKLNIRQKIAFGLGVFAVCIAAVAQVCHFFA